MMITQQRLKELVNYDPNTGIFTVAKNRKGSRNKVGDVLGSNSNGYIEMQLDAKRYYAHRLAHLFMTGILPIDSVDHINRDKSDNRFVNLRIVSHIQNMQNDIKPRSHGSLKCRGIYKYKNQFRAKIVCNSKQIHLGTFASMQEASNAYLIAKSKFHPAYEG